MSLTLILIRHAKSDWGAGLKDHDRTLNARGQRDAPAIGAWLARQGHIPHEASVSSARRTRLTWAAIAEAFAEPIPERVVPALYEAASETILGVAREAKAPCLAIIGHNPGIGDTMHRLVAAPPDHPRWRDIPTGATLVLRFEVEDWREIGWGTGVVLDFITPHDLT